MDDRLSFPLTERLGDPRLLVGREREFADFDTWIRGFPKRISKSRVILAHEKSGKTAFSAYHEDMADDPVNGVGFLYPSSHVQGGPMVDVVRSISESTVARNTACSSRS